MDYTNKALGLRVQTQIPLNVKKYSASENTLKNLGLNNNLAFTYEKGLIVYCIQEGTRYEWKEIEIGDIGLLPSNFTYPDNIITFGIDYSNKIYNFVKLKSVDQNNFVRFLIVDRSQLPTNYTKQDICNYVLALPGGERTLADTDSKLNLIIANILG